MTKSIEEVYQQDPSAGNDPSKNYRYPTGDDTTTKEIAQDIDQLANAVSVRIGVSPPPSQTEDLNQFVATIQNNSLTANIGAISNIAYTHYIIVKNTSLQPTPLPTATDDGAFTKGTLAPLYYVGSTPSVPADWTTTTNLYPWLYDVPTATLKKLLTPTGVHGVSITPVATLPPSAITDFTSDSSTDTTITVSFSATTIIDGLTLQYDIIDTNTGSVINSSGVDVIPGTVIITGLSPGTAYSPAVQVYPTSDDTRVYTSDPDPISTTSGATLTFTNVVLSDNGATESEARIDTFTTGGTETADQYYWSLNPTAPDENSAWISGLPTAGVTTIDLGSPGDHSVYFWISLSTDPTNIVAYDSNPATVTLAPDTGNNIFSIDASNSDLVISEMGAPTGTIRVVRSAPTATDINVDVGTSDGTTGTTAISGVNYQPIATTITFPSGTNFVDVNYDVLQENIGHIKNVPNELTFTVTLSNPTSGSINSQNGSAEVTIQGSDGYVGNDDAIDVNNPPTDLTKLVLTGPLVPISGATYDGYEIDCNNLDLVGAIQLFRDADNVTFKRCIIKNAGREVLVYNSWASDLTFTNCVVENWHTLWKTYTGNKASNAFIRANMSGISKGTSSMDNIIVRGVKARGHGRFVVLTFTGSTTGVLMENNHWTNTTNQDLGMTRVEFRTIYQTTSFNARDGHFLQLYNNTGGQHVCRDNIIRSPRSGEIAGVSSDMINFGDIMPTSEGARTFVDGNGIWTSVDNYGDSDFGSAGASAVHIICDTLRNSPDGGYITINHNLLIEGPTGGIFAGSAGNFLARRNWYFTSETTEDVGINTVALGGGSTTTTREFTDNFIMCYRINTSTLNRIRNLRFLPSAGPAPTGWADQNVMDGTQGNDDWDANGERTVKGVKAILNNPAYGDGIRIKFASVDCPAGTGLLRFDDTTETVYFTPYGGSEGVGVALNTTADTDPAYGDWQYDARVYGSDTANWIYIIYDPDVVGALSADKVYPVKVTNFPYIGQTMIMPYNQTTGNYVPGVWAGTETTTVTGSTKPSVPTNVAVVAGSSAGEADISWDDMSVPQYRVYRSVSQGAFELIATTITNSYTDTGLTNGVTYAYQIVSLSNDTPPVASDPSPSVSYTPTDTLPGQLADLDDPSWNDFNLTGGAPSDNGDGTYTFTCLDAFTSGVFKTVTVAAGGVPYDITVSHVGQLATRGRIAASDTTTGGNIWTGNLLGTDMAETTVLTEQTFRITPAGTTFKLCLMTYHSNVGDTTVFGIPRVNAV